jgi:hypothetical protein
MKRLEVRSCIQGILKDSTQQTVETNMENYGVFAIQHECKHKDTAN